MGAGFGNREFAIRWNMDISLTVVFWPAPNQHSKPESNTVRWVLAQKANVPFCTNAGLCAQEY
jgi:hypothetical protein